MIKNEYATRRKAKQFKLRRELLLWDDSEFPARFRMSKSVAKTSVSVVQNATKFVQIRYVFLLQISEEYDHRPYISTSEYDNWPVLPTKKKNLDLKIILRWNNCPNKLQTFTGIFLI